MEYHVVEEKISKYVKDNVNKGTVEYDLNIFDEGLVSSLFMIELMTFLEKNFNIKITTDDLDMNNYKNINHIIDFVMKKMESVNL